MDAEGERQSVRDAKLQNLIVRMEQILVELDGLGFGRIALPLNDAIELARASRIFFENGPIGGNVSE